MHDTINFNQQKRNQSETSLRIFHKCEKIFWKALILNIRGIACDLPSDPDILLSGYILKKEAAKVN